MRVKKDSFKFLLPVLDKAVLKKKFIVMDLGEVDNGNGGTVEMVEIVRRHPEIDLAKVPASDLSEVTVGYDLTHMMYEEGVFTKDATAVCEFGNPFTPNGSNNSRKVHKIALKGKGFSCFDKKPEAPAATPAGGEYSEM